MITNIRFKFGRTPGATPLDVPPTPVTVFVGPNNSGKSKVLREIQSYCSTGRSSTGDVILDSLEFEGYSAERIDGAIAATAVQPRENETVAVDHIMVGGKAGRQAVPVQPLRQALADPDRQTTQFCQWFLKYNTLLLDGQSRITLVNEQPAGNLQQDPHTSLQVLFRDNKRRAEVRRIVNEAFGVHFVIDPTNLGKLNIRLSPRPPSVGMEEKGIHQEAVDFHAAAQPISQASDGVKAFAGIVTEVLAGDPRVILIDEPEAFLHPSLSNKLGVELSRAALSSDKRVFVSTHSASFVMGCIFSGAPVNIIRLTYRSEVATARLLPSDELLELMRHPLLRSTGVLNGLFHEFVVVSESDADRAFYQEVNQRLLREQSDRGIPNCLFINAQNKQTVPTIIRPLRKLGIPAAGIVDIDVIKEGGRVWTNQLDGGYIPQLAHDSLAHLRGSVKRAADASGKKIKRDGGVAIFKKEDREVAEGLLNQLREYGIFVVPNGELESWLQHLEAIGHGPSWLIDIFEKMGSDPESPEYVSPSEGDVWSFIETIKQWLTDPRRKGIPK